MSRMNIFFYDCFFLFAVLFVSVVLGYYGHWWLDRFHRRVVEPCIQAAKKDSVVARKPDNDPHDKNKTIVIPWTSALPRDVVRQIASMCDGRVRLACKTMKEGFDESSFAREPHRPFTHADLSKVVFVTGLCKWMSRVEGTLSAKFDDAASVELQCAEPDILHKLIAEDMFAKPVDLTITCIVDPADGPRMATIYSCIPHFRAIGRFSWWKTSKCNLEFVAISTATFRRIVDMRLAARA